MWLALLVVLASLYSAMLWAGALHSHHHLYVLLLAIQYVLILPAVFGFLRSKRGTSGPPALPLPRLVDVVFVFALVAVPLSWFSTRGLLNPDESGYSFLSRIYLNGHLKAAPLIGAAPSVPDTPRELYFEGHVLRPDAWFPKFPPGWPLALSVGYAVSLPWLVTPLLSVVSLFVLAAIGRQLFSAEIGVAAVVLAVLSSFYLINSIGMMSHTLCALLSEVACLCLFRGLATGRLSFFAGMFSCLGFALQVRPYTAFVLAAVMTVAALWETRANPRLCARVLGVGVLFGSLALAGVLLYNHLYTEHWLVSPYAMAAGAQAPPELSFSPLRIWEGIAEYGRQTFEMSLIGLFPFAYLLAGYALFTERERRREVWILTAIYLALFFAYLAHPEGSGVFFGERFHFEGIFAVFLLAARGLALLAQRWTLPKSVLASALGLLAILQVSQQALTALTVAREGEPYRKIRAAVSQPTVTGVVFLRDSPGFVAKHFNLNQADWAHAPRIFLVDFEPDHRNEWACRYHVSNWTVAEYDPVTRSAVLQRSQTSCAAPGLKP
jgi:hypothetical protein